MTVLASGCQSSEACEQWALWLLGMRCFENVNWDVTGFVQAHSLKVACRQF
jgi:hypothetical protein